MTNHPATVDVQAIRKCGVAGCEAPTIADRWLCDKHAREHGLATPATQEPHPTTEQFAAGAQSAYAATRAEVEAITTYSETKELPMSVFIPPPVPASAATREQCIHWLEEIIPIYHPQDRRIVNAILAILRAPSVQPAEAAGEPCYSRIFGRPCEKPAGHDGDHSASLLTPAVGKDALCPRDWDFASGIDLSPILHRLNDKVSIVYPGYTEVLREVDAVLRACLTGDKP